ncbi:Cwf15 Cwc15 cell cycle control protein [Pisolithus orientalis]|uniref:Cwf15 Cwc15 cell cycle control protein n=1 Tax=Pisolithus orientalis TaxID=936130 RepID=UPI0022242129|nr:Cwf15 Cwc15 cell cycle control protein [Pisolithus orientalis]KAI5995344.1 Cwf15 Cwc15 cell cycle control protein [Pisolithus orientalis]
MSTAHRPTWDPAQAKDVKGGSRQYSVRDMAAHTKLKFRQPGQTSVGEVSRRDLRAELLAAEEDARNRKRKAEGKPPLPAVADGTANGGGEDEEASKRRKMLQEALELDKDEDDDDEDDKSEDETSQKANNDAMDESEEEESEEEDDTDELLRELEKIKRERAEEKARQERADSAAKAAARKVEIATSNPLLNLAAALGQAPGVNTTVPGTFSVKRRWDDDLIFKNQAMNQKRDSSGQFVNDLLRTEFHKKFMAKFIKVSLSKDLRGLP